MNTKSLRISNIFSYHLFETNGIRNVFQVSIGKTLPEVVKGEVLEYYRLQSLPDSDHNPHNTPIDHRDIGIVHVLPTLAQDTEFLRRLDRHAERFCITIMGKVISSEIEAGLAELTPINTLTGVGKFFDSILRKCEDNQPITDNNKRVFKLLLTGILKMDQSLDAENAARILKAFTKCFHPDKTHHKSELYSCVLSNGRRIARVINELWDVELIRKSGIFYKIGLSDFSDDQFIEYIANLGSIKGGIKKITAHEKIENELRSRKILDQQDNFKEKLLKVVIESKRPELLETLMNREDFDINQVKINGETPLIYAIQAARRCGEAIIKVLIPTDINTLGLEGKTPLQIAIDYYRKFPVKCRSSSSYPYHRAIDLFLLCPYLCVDCKDSAGLTALCYFALLPEIDSISFNLIHELISLGANIDHPIPDHGTVRTLLRERLSWNQFADIKKLADNLGSNQ